MHFFAFRTADDFPAQPFDVYSEIYILYFVSFCISRIIPIRKIFFKKSIVPIKKALSLQRNFWCGSSAG